MQQAERRRVLSFAQRLEQLHGIPDPVANDEGQRSRAMFRQHGICQLSAVVRPGKRKNLLACVDALPYLRKCRVVFLKLRKARRGTVRGKIHAGQPPRMQRCAAPQGAAGHGAGETPPKGLQLSGGRQARAHKLHFVKNPEGIIVQQGKVQRPAKTAHGIAPIERAGKELILRADQHGLVFGARIPVLRHIAAHKHMHRRRAGQQSRRSKAFSPLPGKPGGLLRQHAHGQAPDQPPGRMNVVAMAFVQPCKKDGGRLAEAGRNFQHIGPVFGGQTLLIGVRRNAERRRIPVGQGGHERLLAGMTRAIRENLQFAIQ